MFVHTISNTELCFLEEESQEVCNPLPIDSLYPFSSNIKSKKQEKQKKTRTGCLFIFAQLHQLRQRIHRVDISAHAWLGTFSPLRWKGKLGVSWSGCLLINFNPSYFRRVYLFVFVREQKVHWDELWTEKPGKKSLFLAALMNFKDLSSPWLDNKEK